ncbi:M16 family metallopeptidase [Capilliphycus salinus ALCB114379]|uniref:M16 family metallopeptidase n=1 Tax=Capilliphycus salinus TaxID=2768948 RepID=UPI0039A4D2AA
MFQQQSALEFPATIFRLDNGLTVIHQEISATPVVVVDVWTGAGARKEPEPWSGMAHFLEHMIFKGTDQIAPGIFDQVIESRGGVANAATSHDYAHFYITTASQYLEETLPTLAELLLNATIPDDEFIRERDVVLEEIRQAEDDVDWIEFQSLMETVYTHHPYGRSVLGTPEKLMQRTPEEMRCFHRSHYQPENMVVAIVGGVKQDRALKTIEEAFNRFPTPERCPCIGLTPEPKLREIRRQELQLPNAELARMSIAWLGPNVKQLREGYGLDLLSVILAEGRSSRLVRVLREELQWVHHLSSSFSLQQESSILTINALLDPEKIESVEQVILDCISQLHSEPISELELKRSQRLLCNDYAFSTETPAQLAGLYGYYFTVSQPEFSVIYPTEIQSFDTSDIQELAQKYLSLDSHAVTIVRPG